jgi:hypothetical protein
LGFRFLFPLKYNAYTMLLNIMLLIKRNVDDY